MNALAGIHMFVDPAVTADAALGAGILVPIMTTKSKHSFQWVAGT
jgi:hypothetical protein